MNLKFFTHSIRREWLISIIAILSLYISLLYGMPSVVPTSGYDDDLFIGQALSIVSGNWLADKYGLLTLVKGPYHSIQIGLLSIFGIPPLLGLRIFYAASCAFFCSVALRKLPTFLKSLALVSLLFDPVLLGTWNGWRLLRENTYVSIEVLALAFGIYSLDCLASFQKLGQSGLVLRKNKKLIVSLIITYFCLGILMITREGRVTVVFSALTYTILLLNQCRRHTIVFKRSFAKLAAFSLALIVCFNLPIASVKILNYANYGLAISNEYEEGEFKSFYQNLTSVQLVDGQHAPSIPIKEDVIGTIISLSGVSKLGNTLSNLNEGWKAPGCVFDKAWCNEYAAGWFMWALRQSIFETFRIVRPVDFQNQILNLNAELREICNSHPDVLNCHLSSYGYLPYPSRWVSSGESLFDALLDTTVSHVSFLLAPDGFKYGESTQSDENAKAIGVLLTSDKTAIELDKYNQRLLGFNEFGSLLRKSLLVSFFAVLIILLVRRRGLMACLCSSGLVFIAAMFLSNFMVIVLVQVTSFPSSIYLTMVSPLATLFIWRFYDRLYKAIDGDFSVISANSRKASS